jgi:LEA14-like dessication related protein
MKKLFQLSLIISSILLLSSCFKIEEVEIKEIKSVKLLEFTDKGLLVESNIRIDNPNKYDIKVVDSEFNVVVNNKKIGKAHIGSELNIPASSQEYHTLLLESSTSDLSSTAIPSFIAITATGKDQLHFKVDGYIVGKVWWIKKKVDVGHEGKVDLQLF